MVYQTFLVVSFDVLKYPAYFLPWKLLNPKISLTLHLSQKLVSEKQIHIYKDSDERKLSCTQYTKRSNNKLLKLEKCATLHPSVAVVQNVHQQPKACLTTAKTKT